MKFKTIIFILLIIGTAVLLFFKWDMVSNVVNQKEVGTVLDSFNGVKVYYNGKISNIEGRNISDDGYNLGLKYQCVEFVKRYYYEYYHHKMPDSYGNAKDFFDGNVKDGDLNLSRNLIQCNQPSKYKPQVGDLLVFDGHQGNPYGHVAIVSKLNENSIEIIQQNPGIAGKSRDILVLNFKNNLWYIDNRRVLGWLRLNKS